MSNEEQNHQAVTVKSTPSISVVVIQVISFQPFSTHFLGNYSVSSNLISDFALYKNFVLFEIFQEALFLSKNFCEKKTYKISANNMS